SAPTAGWWRPARATRPCASGTWPTSPATRREAGRPSPAGARLPHTTVRIERRHSQRVSSEELSLHVLSYESETYSHPEEPGRGRDPSPGTSSRENAGAGERGFLGTSRLL